MVKREKVALVAIQRLLVRGRTMAYEANDKKFAEFFDELEYLPSLILEEDDKSDFFQQYLKGICENFDCIEIYNLFLNKDPFFESSEDE